MLSLLTLSAKGSSIAAAPEHHAGKLSSAELQINTATKEKVEAEYSIPMGDGIRISSEVSPGDEAVRVSIQSTSGETIFEVSRLLRDHNLRSHISVAGEKYLLVNKAASDEGDVTKMTIYHKSGSNSYQAESMEYDGFLSGKPIFHQLDSQTAHISGQNAIANLMSHPKAHLIREAAFALGHYIQGRNNPAAMAYYATALRLSKLSDQSAHLEDDSEIDSLFEGEKRYQRWGSLVDAFRSKQHCRNSNSKCPKGRCPKGKKCRGLCGPGCTCWWFICRDCCWNIGCDQHDRICTPNGRYSIECLASAPIGLVCS
jgi:hypothetical protein